MSSSSLPLQPMAAAAAAAATQKQATAGAGDRFSSASFPSTVWEDGFLDKVDMSIQAKQKHPKYEVLKEDVRKMVIDNEVKRGDDDEAVIGNKLRLIDAIQRLGVRYHFEAEIEEALKKIHDMGEDLFSNFDHDKGTPDLYHAALRFRLLRQQGFQVSADVFTKLKNSEGKFKEWVAADEKGVLSLYEAAHIAFHGEDILDEALSFTTKTLKSIRDEHKKKKVNPSFQKQIDFALRLPAWKCSPRSLARHSIDFYSEDRKLLTFAKLDFNMVQSFHQQEIRELSDWWRGIDVATNFPYARDRLMESYFIIICYYFEPKYGLARIMNTKLLLLLSLFDDTFDSFATPQELRSLAEAVERLDVRALQDLPDRMKNMYSVMLNLYDDIERELGKTVGPTFAVDYAKGEIKKICRAYVHKLECRMKGQVPTMEEYKIDFSYRNSGMPHMTTCAFVGMEAEIATREAFEWVSNHSKLMKASSLIGRFQNDIFSDEFEQRRDHAASSVGCVMKQYGVSREEAVEFLWKEISHAWKDVAEECYRKPTPLSSPTLMDLVLNVVRFISVVYDNGDTYTNGHLMKDHLISLFIDPVPL